MSLKEYHQKRKFTHTPEPKGRVRKTKQARFVIHKHQARHLHYDFRLEMAGVLKSWAVPKGPPEKEGIKRLALEVEDHPVDYISFQGRIPAGLYGAGRVSIWDRGKFTLIVQDKRALKFRLQGNKLKGEYVLVHLRKNQWLLYKV